MFMYEYFSILSDGRVKNYIIYEKSYAHLNVIKILLLIFIISNTNIITNFYYYNSMRKSIWYINIE